jgi:flagellar biosynthesis protein FlhF
VANTAEGLSMLAEVLGVPVERCKPVTEPPEASELIFIDLPGVLPGDSAALSQLQGELAELKSPTVHLVLNAAYEGPLLLEQSRAFQSLNVHDVVLTHLDEERRRGKIWNLVLGTNYRVSHLSAGQNVPGGLEPAEAEHLMPF